jgi:hypothetical protein
MHKSTYLVLAMAAFVAAMLLVGGSQAVIPTHTYLLADGGQPPPGPTPFCLPPIIPCSPKPAQGQNTSILVGYALGDAAASPVVDRREQTVAPRPA